LEATSGPLKPKSWKRGGTRCPAAWPLKRSRSSTSSWRRATRPLQEAMKFIRKMEPQPSLLSTSARLMNILETERWRKSATSHEAAPLQQQQEERRDQQHQHTGDEEHGLPGGKTTEEDGTGADPSAEHRRTMSSAHLV
jgi:hypothetical protein